MNTLPPIATSEEQSARLRKCGVSKGTADMVWRKIYDPTETPAYIGVTELWVMKYYSAETIYGIDDIIPAWSLSRLLALIPPTIKKGNQTYYLDFAPFENKGWGFGYYNENGIRSIKGLTNPSDPIEASVNLIEWLKNNGYELQTLTV